MKKLIKMATAVASIGAMLCFAGCGAKGPDAVALDFMQKLSSGQANLEYLTKNCTEDTAKLFATFGDAAAEEIKGATFKVIKTEIKGDTAVVSIEQTHANKTTVNKMDLVKVDGVWRVDVKKDGGGSNDKDIADACVSNMKQIQTAWEMALMAGQEVKRVSDLCGEKGYIKVEPECPLGGKYKIDENGHITCPSGAKGHALPQ